MAWRPFVTVLLFLVVSACGDRPEPEPTGRTTIAVIPKGTSHEFWKSVHAGAARAAQDLGVDLIWKGPLKEDDREAQIAVVEDFITAGVSGIVLAPLDDTALRAPVVSAVQHGIPVVIIDSGLRGAGTVSFVATDNYKGGRLAGEEMARRLGGNGSVAVLRYQEGSASTVEREQGFLDALAQHPGIAVVSENQHGGATTESAYRAAENILSPLRDEGGRLALSGLFCPNESTTFGMLRALQDAGLAGAVTFIGFDSSEKLVEALRAGHLHALVLQNPARMGYLGVKAMAEHLEGRSVEPRIDTGVALATASNMNDPDIAALLAPPLR